MIKDLHNHTIFSDGRNSAREMVEAAIEKGVGEFGISDHSYTAFDESYCMHPDQYEEYVKTISELKTEYKDKITLLCGIEYDYYSDIIPKTDYIIGSLHYLKIADEYVPLDLSAEVFEMIGRKYFDDDFYVFCERYYETLSDLYAKTGADIVGHFDLISKFNEGNRFFDENDERYKTAWKKAMLKIVKDIKCFEINYGAYNKGLRSVPYLYGEMKDFLLSNNGEIICSSDSHSTLTIGSF